MTLEDFVEIGLFGTIQAAHRRFGKLGIQKKTTIPADGVGKHKNLYFLGRLAANPQHEWCLSRFLLRYPFPMVRGHGVDSVLRPDATMWIEDEAYHVELDRGTETTHKVKRQMEAYEQREEWVLVVCLSERRAESLYRRFEGSYGGMMFSVLEEVLGSPYGRIWRGWKGGERYKWAVEKPVEKVVRGSTGEERTLA